MEGYYFFRFNMHLNADLEAKVVQLEIPDQWSVWRGYQPDAQGRVSKYEDEKPLEGSGEFSGSHQLLVESTRMNPSLNSLPLSSIP